VGDHVRTAAPRPAPSGHAQAASVQAIGPAARAPQRPCRPVVRAHGRDEIQPLDRLEITLWNKAGARLGLLARLRDVLPGTYQFGLTGRSPAGALLDRGRYRLKIVADPVAPGPATVRWVGFTIR